MATFFITAAFFALVIGVMSVGVIMGRKPIAGSCGGVGAALQDDDYICDLCGNDPKKCEEEISKGNRAEGGFYELK
jgi:hypothetical protein